MPAFATAPNLSHYAKLRISSYREQLRQGDIDSFRADYVHRGKSYNYSIKLSRTPCNYGGHRHWFNCPSCSRRTSVLYRIGTYVCRHCTRAAYGSQLEQPIDNLFRRLNAIRARLGWQAGIAHGVGERPKGMHRTTYNKIIWEYMNLMDRLLGAQCKMLNIQRYPHSK